MAVRKVQESFHVVTHVVCYRKRKIYSKAGMSLSPDFAIS